MVRVPAIVCVDAACVCVEIPRRAMASPIASSTFLSSEGVRTGLGAINNPGAGRPSTCPVVLWVGVQLGTVRDGALEIAF